MNNKATEAKKVNSSKTKAVSKPSFNTIMIEEMTTSIEMVKRNIEQFKPKSRFRWAFNSEIKVEMFNLLVSVKIAEGILSEISSDRNEGYLTLINLSRQKYVNLKRSLLSDDIDNVYEDLLTMYSQVRGYIVGLLGDYNREYECRLSEDTAGFPHHSEYAKNILQAFDVLTFKLPKWLRTIKNKKISAIGQQFKYMDDILLKPMCNSYYRFFVTDGYKSDVLIKDKRSEKEYWLSAKDNPHVPRIGTGEVRVFKINISKGKKPYYTEIEFGSSDYTDIVNTIPRISRELENEIAVLKEEKIPASQDKLEALAAKFKR